MKKFSMALCVLLLCLSAHAEIVSDKKEVRFCRTKESSIETVTLKNVGAQPRNLQIINPWGNGFSVTAGDCTVGTGVEKSCSLTLEPGKEAKLDVTVIALVGGEQYGELHVKSQSISESESHNILNISMGASDFGGCWDSWTYLSNRDSNVLFNALKDRFDMPCGVSHIESNSKWCNIGAAQLYCSKENDRYECHATVLKVTDDYYIRVPKAIKGEQAQQLNDMLLQFGARTTIDGKVIIGRVKCEKDLGSFWPKYVCSVRN